MQHIFPLQHVATEGSNKDYENITIADATQTDAN